MTDDIAAIAAGLRGVIISQQEPGTIIRHPDTGEELTVTDTNAVNMGHTIYVTPTIYQALRRHLEQERNDGR